MMINKELLKEEAIKLLKEDGHTDVAYAKRKMILIIEDANEVLLFHNSTFSSSYIVEGFVKSNSKFTNSAS